MKGYVMAKISCVAEVALRWNEKLLSSFLKGFQLSKMVSDLRVRLQSLKKSNNTIIYNNFLL